MKKLFRAQYFRGLVCLFLTANQVTGGLLPVLAAEIPLAAPASVSVPAWLGRETDFFQGSGKTFVVHIQDAHSNPSAQKNIARLLAWIDKQNPDETPMIALEGAQGSLHPGYLNFFPDHPKVNKVLVQHLVNQGELTGAEVYAWRLTQANGEREKVEGRRWKVEGKSSISHDSLSTIHYPRFVGVEDAVLYRENLGIYREFLEHETEIKTALDTLRRELYQRENNTLSKEAREYLREKRRRKEGDYESGQRSALSVQRQESPQWETYLAYLKKELKEKVQLDLEVPFEQIRFPNTVRLDVLMRAFKDLNLAQAQKEKENFLNELEKKVRAEQDKQIIRSFNDSANQKNLRERAEQMWALALNYRIDPKKHPEFWRMTGRDILQAELDVVGLTEEFRQLEGWLEKSLAETAEAEKVFRLGHEFERLEKLLSLEMSAGEVAGEGWKASAQKDLADPSFGGKEKRRVGFQDLFDLVVRSTKIVSFPPFRSGKGSHVNTANGSVSFPRRRESVALVDPRLREDDTAQGAIEGALMPWIKKAKRFYELAQERDKTLLENTLKAAEGKKTAILITGGFHTEGLTARMRERGIGYVVIQPQMTVGSEDLYRKVLREENADVSAYFEKPFLNRQEALFFKNIVEKGASELWDKEQVPHVQMAALVANALSTHAVLKDRFDISIAPEGKQASRLTIDGARLRHQPVSAGAWPHQDVQAVVATLVTNGIAFYAELSPARALSEARRVKRTRVTYQPVGTAVLIQPETEGSLRSEMRTETSQSHEDFDKPFFLFAEELEKQLGPQTWWRQGLTQALQNNDLPAEIRSHITASVKRLDFQRSALAVKAREAGERALTQTPAEAQTAYTALLGDLSKFKSATTTAIFKAVIFLENKFIFKSYPFFNFFNLYYAHLIVTHKTLGSSLPFFDKTDIDLDVAKARANIAATQNMTVQVAAPNPNFKPEAAWFEDFKSNLEALRELYRSSPDLNETVGRTYDLLLERWEALTQHSLETTGAASRKLRNDLFQAMNQLSSFMFIFSNPDIRWHVPIGSPDPGAVHARQAKMIQSVKVFFDAAYLEKLDTGVFFELNPDGSSLENSPAGADFAHTIVGDFLHLVSALKSNPLFTGPLRKKLSDAVEGATPENFHEKIELLGESFWEAAEYAAATVAEKEATLPRPSGRRGYKVSAEDTYVQRQWSSVAHLKSASVQVRMMSVRVLEMYYAHQQDFLNLLRVSMRAMRVQLGNPEWNRGRRLEMASALNGLAKYDLERAVLKAMLSEPLTAGERAEVLSRYAPLLAAHFPLEARVGAEALISEMEAALKALAGTETRMSTEETHEQLTLEIATYHLIAGGRVHAAQALQTVQPLAYSLKDRIALFGLYAARQTGEGFLAEGNLAEAERWFAQAGQHAETFVTEQAAVLEEARRESWRNYYRGLMAASAEKNAEALDFFEKAAVAHDPELVASILFGKAVLLKKLGREPEALQEALTFFQVRDAYQTDENVSRWMDHTWSFSSEETRAIFLELTKTVMSAPQLWGSKQTLRSAVELVLGERHMKSQEILDGVESWLFQNEEDVVLGVEQLPALGSVLDGLQEVMPLTLSERAMAWRWEVNMRRPAVAQFLQDWLAQKSADSASDVALQDLSTRFILAKDVAQTAGPEAGNTETRDIDDLFKLFAQGRLIHFDYDMTRVLGLARDVYAYTTSSRVGLPALSNISFYSATLIACKKIYEDLQDQATKAQAARGHVPPELAAVLVRFKTSFLKATQEEFFGVHSQTYTRFMKEAEKEPSWRLLFYLALYETADVLGDQALQVKAFEGYVRVYKEAPSAGDLPVMLLRRAGPSMFTNEIERLIRERKIEQAQELMTFYAPLWEQALNYLETNADLPPDARLYHLESCFKSIGDLSDKAWFYMTLPQSPLRPVLAHFLEVLIAFEPDLMEPESSDPHRFFKLLTLGRVAVFAGQMDFFKRFARVLETAPLNLTSRAVPDLLLLARILLKLNTEETAPGAVADEKTKARIEEVFQLLEHKITAHSAASARADFEILKIQRKMGQSQARETFTELNRLASQAQSVGETASEDAYLFHSILAYALAGQLSEAAARAGIVAERASQTGEQGVFEETGDFILEEVLLWPQENRQKVVEAYLSSLRALPRFSGAAVERSLEAIEYLDRAYGARQIGLWLRAQLNDTQDFNPERALRLLEWLKSAAHPTWEIYRLAERFVNRSGIKTLRSRAEAIKKGIESTLTVEDWEEILREEFDAGNDDYVIATGQSLIRKFSGTAAVDFRAGAALVAKAEKRKEISARVSAHYNSGKYHAARVAFSELSQNGIPAPVASVELEKKAAALEDAIALAQNGLWEDGLKKLQGFVVEGRDARFSKEMKRFEEFQTELAGVKADLDAHRYKAAELALTAAVQGYKERWQTPKATEPRPSQGELGVLRQRIAAHKSEVNKILGMIREGDYLEVKEAALKLAKLAEEEIQGVFQAVLEQAVLAFNEAGELLEAQEKRKAYQDAFHLARLVYELTAEFKAEPAHILKAQEMIAQAVAHLWLPQIEDDFWIMSAMDQAEELRAEQERGKLQGKSRNGSGPIEFDFSKHAIEATDLGFRIRNLTHSKADTQGKPIPVNISNFIWHRDTFEVRSKPKPASQKTAAADPESPKPKRNYFRVISRAKNFVEFEVPKTRGDFNARRDVLIRELQEGGSLARKENTAWTRHKNLLWFMIDSLKINLRDRLEPVGSVLALPTTGNAQIDAVMGLDFSHFHTDQTRRQGEEMTAGLLREKVDRYEAEQKLKDAHFTAFDPEQKEALVAMLNPFVPFVLIQGPPGTGKTTVIKAAIQMLSETQMAGTSSTKEGVAVVSQQNHAVDKVLRGVSDDLTLKGARMRLARVGTNADNIKDAYAAELQSRREILLAEIDGNPRESFTVYGTANGLPLDAKLVQQHPAILERIRTMIMDESTRATPVEGLYLMDFFENLKKTVLVGDPFQLPAYGVSEDEQRKALGVFKTARLNVLQDDKVGSRILAEIFARPKTQSLKISLFEKSLNLFLEPDEQGEIFTVTRPPFFYFNVNRRSGYDMVAELNHFYDERQPLTAGRSEPGFLILDDTAGASPEINTNGTAQDSENTGITNPGEAARAIYWLNDFINAKKLAPEEIALITPYKKQVVLIEATLKSIARLHAYLISREQEAVVTGVAPAAAKPDLRGFMDMEEEEARVRIVFDLAQTGDKNAAWREFQKKLGRLKGTKSIPEAQDLARQLRKALGLGESFVVITTDINGNETMPVTVTTVDSSIGDEWKGVILSWVRSNKEGLVGFLGGGKRSEGWRRRNVGSSRAQQIKVEIGDISGTFLKANRRLLRDGREVLVVDKEMRLWADHKTKVTKRNERNRERLGGNLPDPMRDPVPVRSEVRQAATAASPLGTRSARAEVRSASLSTLKSVLRRNRDQGRRWRVEGGSELEVLLYRKPATVVTEQVALKFVNGRNLGRSEFSSAERAIANAAGVFYNPRLTTQDSEPRALLEAYGRLIRTLLEDAGEDEAQIAKVREVIARHLGEYAKVLEGATDANYQYLDLVKVEELNEDTAYALAILSIVRPRGDEIRLYVSGEDGAVRKQIDSVTNSYENILRKLGAPGRANLKMINVSGWDSGTIQKDILAFATGKNGKLQAAILSARADFLEAFQVMKNIHRMNRSRVGREQALLLSPALLAQELDEHTLDVLQMKDELERLGLGALLSERFGQMIAEIKLLAASA